MPRSAALRRHHGLQVVALLAGDADGLALGLAGDALGPCSLISLLISRALSEEMPTLIVATWRTVFWVASSTSPYSRPFSDTLALDQLLLDHQAQRGQAVLAGRAQREHEIGLLDRRVGVLEVEAGADLPLRLVDGVAHLLAVDLGHDIEAGHASEGSRAVRSSAVVGRCPSGQREQTVNLPATPTEVRILPGPPAQRVPVRISVARCDRIPDRIASGARQRAQSRRCITATSSQRLNLRPTSRSMPTSSNPHRACRARDGRAAGLDAGHHGVEPGRPWRRRAGWSAAAVPMPSPLRSRSTYTESSTVVL